MRKTMLCAFALVFVCGAASAETFSLRGFGKTDARFSEEGGVSVLTLRAESAEKAKLWQAKYLSDMTNTIGKASVKTLNARPMNTLAKYFQAVDLGDRAGYAAAIREGKTVTILTAPTEVSLIAVADKKGATSLNTLSATAIPTYINGWDQHAFRFYYWAGQKPQGVKEYDALQEFDFMSGKSGVIFWTAPHRADRAEGIDDANQWNWAFDAATRRDVPVVLNLSVAETVSIGNAYREENMQHAPNFAGTYLRLMQPGHSGGTVLSWASDTGRHRLLSGLQGTLRKYNTDAVIDILEPHGELNHGDWTVLIEHGPLVDKSFRAFLKERYGSLRAVEKRHGKPYGKWDNVCLPEIAEFAGWGSQAVGIEGDWKVHYPALKEGGRRPGLSVENDIRAAAETDPALFAVDCDDSQWRVLYKMSGSDEGLFHPKQPAVVRRTFQWKARPGKQWLYLWDLNTAHGQQVSIHINGKEAGRSEIPFATPHWMVCEVSGLLKEGENLIAVSLPNGFIGYRAYITPDAPAAYPYFPGSLNALWADFSDWQGWSREKAVEQGVAMIREAEPDKPIICMSPDHYVNQLREICRKYGARFHNTGYMAACHAEYLPMLMRGVGLPFSLEPGGSAQDLPEFKRFLGYYLTEGVNAIHYFIHVGMVLWNPPIREHFEKTLPALRMMGQYHQPKSDVAMLFDSDINALMGYPWRMASSAASTGFWEWRFPVTLIADYPPDGIIPVDFSNGVADDYKVVIDSNCMLMRDDTRAGIKRWVERGGTFVAMYETGRHTPETPDAWALQDISGYRPRVFSQYQGLRNDPVQRVKLTRADGQEVFIHAHREMNGDGATLESVAPGTTPLYRWEDGTTAIGIRPLGKGHVITFGMRLLPSNDEHIRLLLCDVLKWAGARPMNLLAPRHLNPKHYVSNNGLTDIWVVWNHHDKPLDYTFAFRDGKPRALTDALTGQPADPAAEIPPFEFRMLTSPRENAPADATRIWLGIQRGYWQGTEKIKFAAKEKDTTNFGQNVLPLDGTWAVNGQPMQLTSWTRDTVGDAKRFTAEKTFTVPKHWKNGETALWCVGLYTGHLNITGRARFLLNGEEVAPFRDGGGVAGLPLPLSAGQAATLRIEIENSDDLCVRGLAGQCFLAFTPTPARTVDLSGEWDVRREINTPPDTKQRIPGNVTGGYISRAFEMPTIGKGERVHLYMKNDRDITGAIINDRYVRRNHHMFGEVTYLDVTHIIKPGAPNRIVLCGHGNDPNRTTRFDTVQLHITR
ncbi:MAG: hypothetical protein FWG50_10010 [Kiritimatiellaeota bacterium]|nr:hypothetical protein [Kiritimatiellota bacterium]